MKTKTAYHFLRLDMTSAEGSESAWKVGETRVLKASKIEPCKYGYHASPTLYDAMQYATGPVACLVKLSGTIIKHGNPTDKYAASSRKLTKAVDIHSKLVLFAVDCAEHVLHLYEDRNPNDDRPRKAIESARRFIESPTKKNANAAYVAYAASAASAAAYAASAASAAYAAYAASAASAAYAAYAASAAANAAYAAANAAYAAAYAASAASAASAAAYAAEKKWQKKRFDFYFKGIFK